MTDHDAMYADQYELFLEMVEKDQELQHLVLNKIAPGHQDVFLSLAEAFYTLWEWDADFLVCDMKMALKYYASKSGICSVAN